MKTSEFITSVKEKYKPLHMDIHLTTCSTCRHPETKYCLKCGDCGRQFDENGIMIQKNTK